MKKVICAALVMVLCSANSNAQIAVTKIVGKNSDQYALGIGLFLDLAYPVNEADYATLEGGANIFNEKNDDAYGWINCPVKLGYRYTVNRKGTGFYLEPSVGYNVYGLYSYQGLIDYGGYFGYGTIEKKFNGIILSPGIGYLFNVARTNFNVKAYYETNLLKGDNLSYAGLKLSHTFSYKKRN